MLERNPPPRAHVQVSEDMVPPELVAACRRRDQAAFAALVRATYRRAYGLAFRLVRDRFEAEDVVQEAYLRMFRSMEGFREEARVETWMHRIVTNVAITRLRSRGRSAELVSDELPEDESEFEKAGLTVAPAVTVQHPRIAEAAACLECRLYRLIEISGTRELVLGEIQLIHARDGIIDPQTKRISEAHYRPIGRLFADRYCTTRQRFNLPGELP